MTVFHIVGTDDRDGLLTAAVKFLTGSITDLGRIVSRLNKESESGSRGRTLRRRWRAEAALRALERAEEELSTTKDLLKIILEE